MNLKDHYDVMYRSATRKIRAGNYSIDPMIQSKGDRRLGITLVIRPCWEVTDKIQQFTEVVRELEPGQYYYPASDMHITVLSIVSCFEGFDLGNMDVPSYIRLIKESLSDIKPFDIALMGITASSDAIMIRGFPGDESLNQMRDSLRRAFRPSGLFHTIDKRYSLFTAHATVIRFQNKLQQKERLIELMDMYQDKDFGTLKVKEVELVFNDWYQRSGIVRHLQTFQFSP